MALSSHWESSALWELFDLRPMFFMGLQSYLDSSLEKTVDWFRASGGSIFLGPPQGPFFTLAARVGVQKSLPSIAEIKLDDGIAGVVARTGKGRIIDDPNSHPDLRQDDHRPRPISSAMVVPLLDQQGRPVGVLNISRSVGEPSFTPQDLAQAETLAAQLVLAVTNAQMVNGLRDMIEETRLSNEKLTAVLDSVAGAIVVIDPQGQVVNHNQAAAAHSFLDLSPDHDLTDLRKSLQACAELVLARPERQASRVHDGQLDRTWLVEATPLASGGAVLTVQEITEHERQQRELARVKRLAEIGQMTAAIAHEVRNPLTGIRSAAQMIRQSPELSEEFSQMIEEEALKLNGLCDDFLDFAKPMRVTCQAAQLFPLVESVCRLLASSAEENSITLTWESSCEQPTLNIDPGRIEQVIHNLVRNAIQATPQGGHVAIKVEGGQMTISDSGKGMNEEELSRLFSPFFTTKSD